VTLSFGDGYFEPASRATTRWGGFRRGVARLRLRMWRRRPGHLGGEGEGSTPVRATAGGRLFALAALAAFGSSVVLTWLRLFLGMDLRDESFYILIPWRFALGDQPFVNEQSLAQLAALMEYPFIKAFEIVRHGDPTGLVLYGRHLYLFMMVAVAVAAFLLLRHLVRWELALAVAGVFVTFIQWHTPQLSYNTIALAFLSLSSIFGLWVVCFDRGRGWAFASGAALGVAVVAYPTLLFIVPFIAVLFVFAHGRRAVGTIAQISFARPPDPPGPPTGLPAWRSLSFWVLGGLAVLLPMGLLIFSFGWHRLRAAWALNMQGAQQLGQVGGASKAVQVAQGYVRFFWSRPLFLVGALAVYLVYRRWPRVGRTLLLLLPIALWSGGQRPLLQEAGFALAYGVIAPYIYLFVPVERRTSGARLLLWVWAPAMLAGAMTAFTSAAGYVTAAVGLAPAMLASGLFLAWALEAVTSPPEGEAASGRIGGRPAWLALAALVAVLGVTLGLQVEYQQRAVPFTELKVRCDLGPWWGIALTEERYALVRQFATDLDAQARHDDWLLVLDAIPGYYLFWNGHIASNELWMGADPDGQLPQWVISYYRRHRIVPTLVANWLPTAGMTDAELQAACGGLDYPPTLVRPMYAFQRKPADESTAEVLAGLPRQ
jgi:hypothetical protein